LRGRSVRCDSAEPLDLNQPGTGRLLRAIGTCFVERRDYRAHAAHDLEHEHEKEQNFAGTAS